MDNLVVAQNQTVIEATENHSADILAIYKLAQIKPKVFHDLISPSAKRSTAARALIGKHGGFLCPPDNKDMALTLQHGLGLVYLQNEKVAGFNRCVTDPVTVYQLFCAEFQLDETNTYNDPTSFSDWTGNMRLKPYRTLKRIHWTDRQQTLLALKAAKAGLQNKVDGKLVWALDAAVHPENRRSGISKTLIDQLKQILTPAFSLRAYRMFEIRKINDIEVVINNDASKRIFVDPATKHFAYTEEEIRIGNDICITVRWNNWLRHH